MSSNNQNTNAQDTLVDTDSKFLRFLLSDLFRDGTHVWWLIGLCSVLTLTAIVFSFFGAIIDSDILFDAHTAKQIKHITIQDNEETRKVENLTRSRRELDYPYLPIEFDATYSQYLAKIKSANQSCPINRL